MVVRRRTGPQHLLSVPTIRVSGITELRKALAQANSDAPKELAKANKQIGMIVVPEAQRRAPHGKHEGGGAVLPIALSIKAAQLQTKVTITAGGPKSPHAAVYEFGGTIPRANAHGRKIVRHGRGYQAQLGRSRVTHIKRRPYLYPAVTAKLNQVVDAYFAMVDRILAKFGS